MSQQHDKDLNPKQQEKALEIQPSPNQEPNLEKLSEMAGMAQEEEANAEIQEPETDSYLVTTQGAFWEQVGVRSVIVATTVLLGVLFLAWMGKFMTTAFNNKDTPQQMAQKPKVIEESIEEDTGRLKTEVALGSQKAELEKLNSKILTPTPKPSPAATVKVNTTPTPKAISQPRTISVPKVPNVATTSRPVSKYEPASPVEQPIILSSQPAVPVPPPIKNRPPEAVQVARKVVIQPPDSLTKQNKASAKTEVVKPDVQISNPEVSTTYHTEQSLIVGTRADARLQNAIVLAESSIKDRAYSGAKVKAGKNSRSRTDTLHTYPVKLTQDLKTPAGLVVIPKNSFLITQVQSVSKEGWIDLSVISIAINSKKGTLIKPVPPQAILVQKRDGSPLQAKFQTLSVPHQADKKETISANSRTSRLPVRHGIDPIHNENPQKPDSKAKVEHQNQFLPSNGIRIITLNKGTKVQVYVNSSFGLFQ